MKIAMLYSTGSMLVLHKTKGVDFIGPGISKFWYPLLLTASPESSSSLLHLPSHPKCYQEIHCTSLYLCYIISGSLHHESPLSWYPCVMCDTTRWNMEFIIPQACSNSCPVLSQDLAHRTSSPSVTTTIGVFYVATSNDTPKTSFQVWRYCCDARGRQNLFLPLQ